MKLVNKEVLEVGDMSAQMLERRPLPIGRNEFMEWSDRIIEGSMVKADKDSLRFCLAGLLMHMGQTEAFREDAYFILSLRHFAVNETAAAMMQEYKEAQEKKKLAEDTASKLEAVNGILEIQKF